MLFACCSLTIYGMRKGYRASVERVLAATAASLSVVLAMVATLPPATLGADHTLCLDPLPVNRHNGQGIAGSPDGVSANLEHQTLSMCQPPAAIELNGTFAYVNIEGPPGILNDIIQSGMGQCRGPFACDAGMHAFAGYGIENSSPGCAGFQDIVPILDKYAWPSGTIYQVYHQSNVWKFYAGGFLLKSIPESAVCWAPAAATWFGESLDVGDAIGGSVTDHFFITSMKSTQTEGGAFAYTNLDSTRACSINSTGNHFCDLVGPSSLAIWSGF